MATKGYTGCIVQVLDNNWVLIVSADDTSLVPMAVFKKHEKGMLESASPYRHTYFEPMDPVTPDT